MKNSNTQNHQPIILLSHLKIIYSLNIILSLLFIILITSLYIFLPPNQPNHILVFIATFSQVFHLTSLITFTLAIKFKSLLILYIQIVFLITSILIRLSFLLILFTNQNTKTAKLVAILVLFQILQLFLSYYCKMLWRLIPRSKWLSAINGDEDKKSIEIGNNMQSEVSNEQHIEHTIGMSESIQL